MRASFLVIPVACAGILLAGFKSTDRGEISLAVPKGYSQALALKQESEGDWKKRADGAQEVAKEVAEKEESLLSQLMPTVFKPVPTKKSKRKSIAQSKAKKESRHSVAKPIRSRNKTSQMAKARTRKG